MCLMHTRHAKKAAPGEEMPCHGKHQAAEPATKCDGAPQCSQRAQAVSLAPLPPGVLAAAPVVESPRASRDSVAMNDLQAVRGFVLLPFQPPRLTA